MCGCDWRIAIEDGLVDCKSDVRYMQKCLTEQKLSDKCVKKKNRDLACVCDQLYDKELSSGTIQEGQQDVSNSKNNSEEKVKIHQVKAGSSFVQLNVGGIPVKARIDSGVEITILSSKIFEKFSKQPTIVKKVVMQMADNDAVLQGFIVKPVQMKLGSQVFKERFMWLQLQMTCC